MYTPLAYMNICIWVINYLFTLTFVVLFQWASLVFPLRIYTDHIHGLPGIKLIESLCSDGKPDLLFDLQHSMA